MISSVEHGEYCGSPQGGRTGELSVAPILVETAFQSIKLPESIDCAKSNGDRNDALGTLEAS